MSTAAAEAPVGAVAPLEWHTDETLLEAKLAESMKRAIVGMFATGAKSKVPTAALTSTDPPAADEMPRPITPARTDTVTDPPRPSSRSNTGPPGPSSHLFAFDSVPPAPVAPSPRLLGLHQSPSSSASVSTPRQRVVKGAASSRARSIIETGSVAADSGSELGSATTSATASRRGSSFDATARATTGQPIALAVVNGPNEGAGLPVGAVASPAHARASSPSIAAAAVASPRATKDTLASPVRQRFFGPGSGLKRGSGFGFAVGVGTAGGAQQMQRGALTVQGGMQQQQQQQQIAEEKKEDPAALPSSPPPSKPHHLNSLSFASLTVDSPSADAASAHRRAPSLSVRTVEPTLLSPNGPKSDEPAPIHHGLHAVSAPKPVARSRFGAVRMQLEVSLEHAPRIISPSAAFAIAAAPVQADAKQAHATPAAKPRLPLRGATSRSPFHHTGVLSHAPPSSIPPEETAQFVQVRSTRRKEPEQATGRKVEEAAQILSFEPHRQEAEQTPPTFSNPHTHPPQVSFSHPSTTPHPPHPDSWSTSATPARSTAASLHPDAGITRYQPTGNHEQVRGAKLNAQIDAVQSLLQSPSDAPVVKKTKTVAGSSAKHSSDTRSRSSSPSKSAFVLHIPTGLEVNPSSILAPPPGSSSRYSVAPTPQDKDYVRFMQAEPQPPMEETRAEASTPPPDAAAAAAAASAPGHLGPAAASSMQRAWHSRSGLVRSSDGSVAPTPSTSGAVAATRSKVWSLEGDAESIELIPAPPSTAPPPTAPPRSALTILEPSLHPTVAPSTKQLEPWGVKGYTAVEPRHGAPSDASVHSSEKPASSGLPSKLGRFDADSGGGREVQSAIRAYIPHTLPSAHHLEGSLALSSRRPAFPSQPPISLPSSSAHLHGIDPFSSGYDLPATHRGVTRRAGTNPNVNQDANWTRSTGRMVYQLRGREGNYRKNTSEEGEAQNASSAKFTSSSRASIPHVSHAESAASLLHHQLAQTKSWSQLQAEERKAAAAMSHASLSQTSLASDASSAAAAAAWKYSRKARSDGEEETKQPPPSDSATDWRRILGLTSPAESSRPGTSGGEAFLAEKLAELHADPRFDLSVDRSAPGDIGPIWHFYNEKEKLDHLLRLHLGLSIEEFFRQRPPTREAEEILGASEMFSGFDSLQSFLRARDRVRAGLTTAPPRRAESTAVNVARSVDAAQRVEAERLSTSERAMGVTPRTRSAVGQKTSQGRSHRGLEVASEEMEAVHAPPTDGPRPSTASIYQQMQLVLQPRPEKIMTGDVTYVRSTRGTAAALVETDVIRRSLIDVAQAALSKVNSGVSEMFHRQKETVLQRANREAQELSGFHPPRTPPVAEAYPSGSVTHRPSSEPLRIPKTIAPAPYTPRLASSRLTGVYQQAQKRIGAGSAWSMDQRPRATAVAVSTSSAPVEPRLRGVKEQRSTGVSTAKEHIEQRLSHQQDLDQVLRVMESSFQPRLELSLQSPRHAGEQLPSKEGRGRPQVFSWHQPQRRPQPTDSGDSSPVKEKVDVHMDYLSQLTRHRDVTELEAFDAEQLASIEERHIQHLNERLEMDLQVKVLEQEELDHQVKLKLKEKERTAANERRRQSIMA